MAGTGFGGPPSEKMMSEDPVKYELVGDAEAVRCLRESRKEIARQIRIEALRAATAISSGEGHVAADLGMTLSEFTLSRAKQFAAYLESGE